MYEGEFEVTQKMFCVYFHQFLNKDRQYLGILNLNSFSLMTT